MALTPRTLVVWSALLYLPASGGTRLKDLVSIEGVRDNQLIGYGLVVGLNGTGDSRQTVFSAQSLANLLTRMGVAVSPTTMAVRNTAAVFVTADHSPPDSKGCSGRSARPRAKCRQLPRISVQPQ